MTRDRASPTAQAAARGGTAVLLLVLPPASLLASLPLLTPQVGGTLDHEVDLLER